MLLDKKFMTFPSLGCWLLGMALLLGGCSFPGQTPDREPPEEPMDERELNLSLKVPDSAWSLNIRRVYEGEEKLYLVARAERDPDVMGAQVITTVRDSVSVLAPDDLPVQVIIEGKTWEWDNEEGYMFIRPGSVFIKPNGTTTLYPPEEGNDNE